MTGRATVLVAEQLTIAYGRRRFWGRPGRDVVSDLSLSLRGGEIVALVGDNGAGKTTVHRALAGELKPRRGHVRLCRGDAEYDLTRLGVAARARLGIGYLPQQPALLWDVSACDNVGAALVSPAARRNGPPRHDARALLARFGLEESAEILPSQLSGGQVRRLELARLAALGSDVLLCDEPLAGLDAQGVSEVLSALALVAEAGAAILITDHRQELLTSVATRRVELSGGVMTGQAQGSSALNAPVAGVAPAVSH